MVMLLVPTKKPPPSLAARARGAKLQALRVRVGKTQQDVADSLLISYKTVSAYENGRAEMGVEDFDKWSAALGVSVAELTTSLGFGLPPETGNLRRDLAVLFGPDSGEDVEQLLHDLAPLPEGERRQIIQSIRDQIAGRHVRHSQD